jgi:hypothetical protein
VAAEHVNDVAVAHTLELQSAPEKQVLPSPHLSGQEPPQSTSGSSPFALPSVQLHVVADGSNMMSIRFETPHAPACARRPIDRYEMGE